MGLFLEPTAWKHFLPILESNSLVSYLAIHFLPFLFPSKTCPPICVPAYLFCLTHGEMGDSDGK